MANDDQTSTSWEAWASDFRQIASERGIEIDPAAYGWCFEMGYSPENALEENDDEPT